MAINKQPVARKCRALGVSPAEMGYGKKQSKRNPGGTRRKKVSEYGAQLKEKQKVKFVYGVLEKQFHKYYLKASNMKGITGDNMLQLLELRLDNVVYRLGFAGTRREARQLVNHGHYTVNGKRVNIPSYTVRPGDEIALTDTARNQLRVKAALEAADSRGFPEWLAVDAKAGKGTFKAYPQRAELPATLNEGLVVELYSR